MEDAKVFNSQDFSQQFRPAWTPVNIALMVLFFATGLWILGLLMIGYMLYGREAGIDFSNWGKTKGSMNKAFDGRCRSTRTSSATGNSAFDEWREAELKRLDEERKKLDEARREFDEYVRELRRARDREEFESFKTNWTSARTENGENSTA